jgi:chromosome segregation ATPase
VEQNILIKKLNDTIENYNRELTDIKASKEKISTQIQSLQSELKEKNVRLGEVFEENSKLTDARTEVYVINMERLDFRT